MVGHWKPLLGHPKHFFRKWLVSMIWSLKVGIVDGGYWGYPKKIQDAGIRTLWTGYLYCGTGDGESSRKGEEIIVKMSGWWINKTIIPDHIYIYLPSWKGFVETTTPLKIIWWNITSIETPRGGSSVRSGLRDIQSRTPQCREAPWRTQRKTECDIGLETLIIF